MPAPRNGIYNPYQVKEEDRDFLTLSANLGVDYNQLRQANPYVQSISTGQYINTPAPGLNPASPNAFRAPALRPPSMPQVGATAGASAGAGALSSSFSNTFSSAAAMPQNIFGTQTGAPRPATGSNLTGMNAFRQQEWIASQVEANFQHFLQTGTLPANTSPEVVAAMVAQGADPSKIKQAMDKGVQTGGATNDPLAGTPGHYYVDETTAPLVGTVITLKNGRRRRLLMDKDGRLYYGKIGQSKRGRAINAARRALEEQAPVVADDIRETPVTALSVILGS